MIGEQVASPSVSGHRVITTPQIVDLIAVFRDLLSTHRESINALNVYPVPDGDTGTNMTLTVTSVLEELDGVDRDDRAAVCQAISHGSLMGARGNSGVILSQILRGLAAAFADAGDIDGPVVAAALGAASAAADGAVMRPVEGTILTVVREASRSAPSGGDSLEGVLEAALQAGRIALDNTPTQLAVLAEAGVVDAGGAGFLLLLDAALHVVADRPLPEAPAPTGPSERPDDHGAGHDPTSDQRYEVMFLLDAPDDDIGRFTDAWAELGDSIVVVGGDGLWNCHIHTDEIGPSIEAAIEVGRPHRIRVTDLAEEVEELRRGRGGSPTAVPVPELVPCAVVAVSPARGIAEIFTSLGVQGLVTGGQTMNPSTAQLLEAVERAPSEQVVILPNNGNIIPVAQQVDAHTTKTVIVVPTRSVPEGFAAMLGYDAARTAEENGTAMTEVAGSVVVGEVTQAVRDTGSPAGDVREGDWIGLDRSGIRSIASDPTSAATGLLAELVTNEHEILTVVVGRDASDVDTSNLETWVGANLDHLEVEVHHGGQEHYPFLFGIE